MGESTKQFDRDELAYRLEQQRILADFGVEALRARNTDAMLDRACALAASGMRTSLSKVLRLREEKGDLIVAHGVGWKSGVVGHATLTAGDSSPAGFAVQSGEAVISNHLEDEDRFRTPDFMANHGIKRAINILIEVNGKNFGVLEVDSRNPGRFGEADLAFMRGFAHLIGVAIERQRIEESLRNAREQERLLTKEASHRVKNSLAMVSSILAMQGREADSEEVTTILEDARERIQAIGFAHDLLWRSDKVGLVDLDDMICHVARNLGSHAPKHDISCDLENRMISADIAIPVGMVVNELITNAVKYAYADGGSIEVKGKVDDQNYVVIVKDRGRGFDPDTQSTKSLGMRLIQSLATQVKGSMDFGTDDADGGTCARLQFPVDNS